MVGELTTGTTGAVLACDPPDAISAPIVIPTTMHSAAKAIGSKFGDARLTACVRSLREGLGAGDRRDARGTGEGRDACGTGGGDACATGEGSDDSDGGGASCGNTGIAC